MSFESAVGNANRLIELFKAIPENSLDLLPDRQLRTIQQQSKSTFDLFSEILLFKLAISDAAGQRENLLGRLSESYQPAFDVLFPLISYISAKTVDFASLESRGRAAIRDIVDEKERVLGQLNETSAQASVVLKEVREAAAEQGVTQMAKYFGDEATQHSANAGKWLIASAISAFVLVAYAISTLFFAKIFSTLNGFESAQIIASKILLFVVLGYGVVQCVRNYSAHRHNYVTNKHRQNALMTYRTLAEAGNTPELRDAVLQHAAAAIYAPNDSGYLKSEERGYGAQGLLALVPRMTGSTPTGSP